MRAGRGFRVILYRHAREVFEAQSFNGIVIEVHMGYLDKGFVQLVFINRKTMVLSCNFDTSRLKVFYRVVGAAMAYKHLSGRDSLRQRHQLVSQADAEYRLAGLLGKVYCLQRIFRCGFGITGPVAEEESVRLPAFQLFLELTFGGEDAQRTTPLYQVINNALLNSIVKSSHFERPFAVCGLSLGTGHLGCQFQAFHVVPVFGFLNQFFFIKLLRRDHGIHNSLGSNMSYQFPCIHPADAYYVISFEVFLEVSVGLRVAVFP